MKTLVLRARNGGFFSNLNCLMANLDRHLGRDGFTAAEVLWEPRADLPQFAYGRPEDGNVWLHFFEPLEFSDHPAERVEIWEYPPDGPSEITSWMMYPTYKLDRRWRQAYHALFTRHIRLRPNILARVAAIMAPHEGQFRLGVHYRNPRHSHECRDPIPPPEVFIARARRLLRWRRNYAVVLASDYAPAVAAFQAAFGDRLVMQPDVARAAAGADQRHHGAADAALRLGEEVLIDCLMLSNCHTLLHVTSNVATAAGYINPRLRLVYCESLGQALRGWRWAWQWRRQRRPAMFQP